MRICSCDLDNDVHYFYASCDTKFAYGIESYIYQYSIYTYSLYSIHNRLHIIAFIYSVFQKIRSHVNTVLLGAIAYYDTKYFNEKNTESLSVDRSC